MASDMKACMTTGIPVEVDGVSRNDDVILVVRRGEVIGVLSEDAQEEVKTLRMTFTRDSAKEQYQPLQGQGIETF